MCQAKTKAVKTQLVILVVSFIGMRVVAQPVKDSLETYVRILEHRPNDLSALSKAAEYCVYLGGREEEASKKKYTLNNPWLMLKNVRCFIPMRGKLISRWPQLLEVCNNYQMIKALKNPVPSR